MFEVQRRARDGWHLVSTPDTRSDAERDAAALRPTSAVRIMGVENGVQVRLGCWGAGSPVPDATGPTPTLR